MVFIQGLCGILLLCCFMVTASQNPSTFSGTLVSSRQFLENDVKDDLDVASTTTTPTIIHYLPPNPDFVVNFSQEFTTESVVLEEIIFTPLITQLGSTVLTLEECFIGNQLCSATDYLTFSAGQNTFTGIQLASGVDIPYIPPTEYPVQSITFPFDVTKNEESFPNDVVEIKICFELPVIGLLFTETKTCSLLVLPPLPLTPTFNIGFFDGGGVTNGATLTRRFITPQINQEYAVARLKTTPYTLFSQYVYSVYAESVNTTSLGEILVAQVYFSPDSPAYITVAIPRCVEVNLKIRETSFFRHDEQIFEQLVGDINTTIDAENKLQCIGPIGISFPYTFNNILHQRWSILLLQAEDLMQHFAGLPNTNEPLFASFMMTISYLMFSAQQFGSASVLARIHTMSENIRQLRQNPSFVYDLAVVDAVVIPSEYEYIGTLQPFAYQPSIGPHLDSIVDKTTMPPFSVSFPIGATYPLHNPLTFFFDFQSLASTNGAFKHELFFEYPSLSPLPPNGFNILSSDYYGCPVTHSLQVSSNNPSPQSSFLLYTVEWTLTFHQSLADLASQCQLFQPGKFTLEIPTQTSLDFYVAMTFAPSILNPRISFLSLEQARGSGLSLDPNNPSIFPSSQPDFTPCPTGYSFCTDYILHKSFSFIGEESSGQIDTYPIQPYPVPPSSLVNWLITYKDEAGTTFSPETATPRFLSDEGPCYAADNTLFSSFNISDDRIMMTPEFFRTAICKGVRYIEIQLIYASPNTNLAAPSWEFSNPTYLSSVTLNLPLYAQSDPNYGILKFTNLQTDRSYGETMKDWIDPISFAQHSVYVTYPFFLEYQALDYISLTFEIHKVDIYGEVMNSSNVGSDWFDNTFASNTEIIFRAGIYLSECTSVQGVDCNLQIEENLGIKDVAVTLSPASLDMAPDRPVRATFTFAKPRVIPTASSFYDPIEMKLLLTLSGRAGNTDIRLASSQERFYGLLLPIPEILSITSSLQNTQEMMDVINGDMAVDQSSPIPIIAILAPLFLSSIRNFVPEYSYSFYSIQKEMVHARVFTQHLHPTSLGSSGEATDQNVFVGIASTNTENMPLVLVPVSLCRKTRFLLQYQLPGGFQVSNPMEYTPDMSLCDYTAKLVNFFIPTLRERSEVVPLYNRVSLLHSTRVIFHNTQVASRNEARLYEYFMQEIVGDATTDPTQTIRFLAYQGIIFDIIFETTAPVSTPGFLRDLFSIDFFRLLTTRLQQWVDNGDIYDTARLLFMTGANGRILTYDEEHYSNLWTVMTQDRASWLIAFSSVFSSFPLANVSNMRFIYSGNTVLSIEPFSAANPDIVFSTTLSSAGMLQNPILGPMMSFYDGEDQDNCPTLKLKPTLASISEDTVEIVSMINFDFDMSQDVYTSPAKNCFTSAGGRKTVAFSFNVPPTVDNLFIDVFINIFAPVEIIYSEAFLYPRLSTLDKEAVQNSDWPSNAALLPSFAVPSPLLLCTLPPCQAGHLSSVSLYKSFSFVGPEGISDEYFSTSNTHTALTSYNLGAGLSWKITLKDKDNNIFPTAAVPIDQLTSLGLCTDEVTLSPALLVGLSQLGVRRLELAVFASAKALPFCSPLELKDVERLSVYSRAAPISPQSRVSSSVVFELPTPASQFAIAGSLKIPQNIGIENVEKLSMNDYDVPSSFLEQDNPSNWVRYVSPLHPSKFDFDFQFTDLLPEVQNVLTRGDLMSLQASLSIAECQTASDVADQNGFFPTVDCDSSITSAVLVTSSEQLSGQYSGEDASTGDEHSLLHPSSKITFSGDLRLSGDFSDVNINVVEFLVCLTPSTLLLTQFNVILKTPRVCTYVVYAPLPITEADLDDMVVNANEHSELDQNMEAYQTVLKLNFVNVHQERIFNYRPKYIADYYPFQRKKPSLVLYFSTQLVEQRYTPGSSFNPTEHIFIGSHMNTISLTSAEDIMYSTSLPITTCMANERFSTLWLNIESVHFTGVSSLQSYPIVLENVEHMCTQPLFSYHADFVISMVKTLQKKFTDDGLWVGTNPQHLIIAPIINRAVFLISHALRSLDDVIANQLNYPDQKDQISQAYFAVLPFFEKFSTILRGLISNAGLYPPVMTEWLQGYRDSLLARNQQALYPMDPGFLQFFQNQLDELPVLTMPTVPVKTFEMEVDFIPSTPSLGVYTDHITLSSSLPSFFDVIPQSTKYHTSSRPFSPPTIVQDSLQVNVAYTSFAHVDTSVSPVIGLEIAIRAFYDGIPAGVLNNEVPFAGVSLRVATVCIRLKTGNRKEGCIPALESLIPTLNSLLLPTSLTTLNSSGSSVVKVRFNIPFSSAVTSFVDALTEPMEVFFYFDLVVLPSPSNAFIVEIDQTFQSYFAVVLSPRSLTPTLRLDTAISELDSSISVDTAEGEGQKHIKLLDAGFWAAPAAVITQLAIAQDNGPFPTSNRNGFSAVRLSLPFPSSSGLVPFVFYYPQEDHILFDDEIRLSLRVPACLPSITVTAEFISFTGSVKKTTHTFSPSDITNTKLPSSPDSSSPACPQFDIRDNAAPLDEDLIDYMQSEMSVSLKVAQASIQQIRHFLLLVGVERELAVKSEYSRLSLSCITHSLWSHRLHKILKSLKKSDDLDLEVKEYFSALSVSLFSLQKALNEIVLNTHFTAIFGAMENALPVNWIKPIPSRLPRDSLLGFSTFRLFSSTQRVGSKILAELPSLIRNEGVNTWAQETIVHLSQIPPDQSVSPSQLQESVAFLGTMADLLRTLTQEAENEKEADTGSDSNTDDDDDSNLSPPDIPIEEIQQEAANFVSISSSITDALARSSFRGADDHDSEIPVTTISSVVSLTLLNFPQLSLLKSSNGVGGNFKHLALALQESTIEDGKNGKRSEGQKGVKVVHNRPQHVSSYSSRFDVLDEANENETPSNLGVYIPSAVLDRARGESDVVISFLSINSTVTAYVTSTDLSVSANTGALASLNNADSADKMPYTRPLLDRTNATGIIVGLTMYDKTTGNPIDINALSRNRQVKEENNHIFTPSGGLLGDMPDELDWFFIEVPYNRTSFALTGSTASAADSLCIFAENPNADEVLYWQQDNTCQVHEVTSEVVVCRCTHLTFFSVRLSVNSFIPKFQVFTINDIKAITWENIKRNSIPVIILVVWACITLIIVALASFRDQYLYRIGMVKLFEDWNISTQEKPSVEEVYKVQPTDSVLFLLFRRFVFTIKDKHIWYSVVNRQFTDNYSSQSRAFAGMILMLSSVAFSGLFYGFSNQGIIATTLMTSVAMWLISEFLRSLYDRLARDKLKYSLYSYTESIFFLLYTGTSCVFNPAEQESIVAKYHKILADSPDTVKPIALDVFKKFFDVGGYYVLSYTSARVHADRFIRSQASSLTWDPPTRAKTSHLEVGTVLVQQSSQKSSLGPEDREIMRKIMRKHIPTEMLEEGFAMKIHRQSRVSEIFPSQWGLAGFFLILVWIAACYFLVILTGVAITLKDGEDKTSSWMASAGTSILIDVFISSIFLNCAKNVFFFSIKYFLCCRCTSPEKGRYKMEAMAGIPTHRRLSYYGVDELQLTVISRDPVVTKLNETNSNEKSILVEHVENVENVENVEEVDYVEHIEYAAKTDDQEYEYEDQSQKYENQDKNDDDADAGTFTTMRVVESVDPSHSSPPVTQFHFNEQENEIPIFDELDEHDEQNEHNEHNEEDA